MYDRVCMREITHLVFQRARGEDTSQLGPERFLSCFYAARDSLVDFFIELVNAGSLVF